MDKKYNYSYEKTANYCYPNSNVLINKLNIRTDVDLFEYERKFVTIRTTEIEISPIKGNLDFVHLKEIHRHLFQDIYHWAGQVRTCDIAKRDLFCLAQHIDSYAEEVLSKLKKENYFLNKSYKEKIVSLVELFADINALHPFREGNGRTQRQFIEIVAKINGIDIDFTSIKEKTMIIASHESINGDYTKFLKMFKECSKPVSKEEQRSNIDTYILNNDLKSEILKYL